MQAFLESTFGYSPQMRLFETPDRVTLHSRRQSKLIIFLMLMLSQILILSLSLPIEYIFVSIFISILGGLTYSKVFIFDGTTGILTIKHEIFKLSVTKEISFDVIPSVHATSNPLRKGTYIFVELRTRRKILLDMTTDKDYINRVVHAINRVRNLTIGSTGSLRAP